MLYQKEATENTLRVIISVRQICIPINND